MLHGQRATTKLVPRQRRFIYRVSALAFWTIYLILSIARRALRALSHRKFTLHFLTKISTRQALCASPFRGRRQAAALIFYFPTLTSLYTFGRAPNDVVVPTVIQHPNMDVTSHPSVRDTFGHSEDDLTFEITSETPRVTTHGLTSASFGGPTSKYGCYVPPKCQRHFRRMISRLRLLQRRPASRLMD